MLFTTIRTFGANVLKEYESGLTMPRAFPNAGSIKAGNTLELYYRLGNHPGLSIEPQ
jgi:hypothetical protein